MALSDHRSLLVDSVNGSPRGDQTGKPDALNFSLGNNLVIPQSRSISKLALRGVNFCLRINLTKSPLVRILLIPNLARLLTSLLLSISLKELVAIKVCRGVGFDPSIRQSFLNTFYVGYFQSYKWLEIAQRKAKITFELEQSSALIKDFKSLAEVEQPLVVHVRLGDYLAENGFGTLDKSYYTKAIQKALSANEFRKIWLFSDDPEGALLKMPANLGIEVRVMPDFEGSPAATLEAMRFGKGYVIGNSTFSWWGATLSYISEPIVIYPYPWFKTLDVPVDLVPPHWSSVDAF